MARVTTIIYRATGRKRGTSGSVVTPPANREIFLPLVSNEPTIYPPTLQQTNVLKLPLVANEPTIYPPSIVASNAVVLPLLNNEPVIYPPQLNQRIILAFTNNEPVIYPPIVSNNYVLVLPLTTNTPTIFPPQLNQTIRLPLVSNEPTVYPPAVVLDTSQLIRLPLVSNEPVIYPPQKLNQQIRLPLVINTPTIIPPRVQQGALPGYALSTPSVTVISAAGDPPEVTLGINSDHYAGYYLDIERSTVATKNASDGSYATPTLKIAHQIEPEELAALAITNADLAGDGYTNPSGVYFQQYRIRREDGALSAWVEISGTVTASVAQLHTVAGFNRASSLTYPSVGHEFEVQNTNLGSLRKARATISATDKKQFEVTVNSWTTSSRIGIGIDDGNNDFASTGLIPGNSNLPNGICFRAQQGAGGTIYANGIIQQAAPANSTLAVGDVVSVAIDTTAATVKFYRTRSGSTVQIGNPVPIGFGSTVYAYGGTERVDNIEFNFGASSFVRALDSGFTIYG